MSSYAGIGSRETPPDVLTLMRAIGATLARQGYTLRTGAARGADTAFEHGAADADGTIELYLPWAAYEQRSAHVALTEPTAAAIELAAQHHPAWERCRQGARKLHGRNSHIALGPSLDDPVAFVVCWTPDAQRGGGTGQALRLVEARGIHVMDLADPATRARADAFAHP